MSHFLLIPENQLRLKLRTCIWLRVQVLIVRFHLRSPAENIKNVLLLFYTALFDFTLQISFIYMNLILLLLSYLLMFLCPSSITQKIDSQYSESTNQTFFMLKIIMNFKINLKLVALFSGKSWIREDQAF